MWPLGNCSMKMFLARVFSPLIIHVTTERMQRCSGLAHVALPGGTGQWREQGLLRGSTSPSSAHSQQQQPVAPGCHSSSPSPARSSSPVHTGDNTALRVAACGCPSVILASLSTSIKKKKTRLFILRANFLSELNSQWPFPIQLWRQTLQPESPLSLKL